MAPAVVLFLSLLSPAAGHLSTGDARSEAVFPPQRITLAFDHSIHVGRLGQPCVLCHATTYSSTSVRDFNVPDRALCLGCHPADEIRQVWGPQAGPEDAVVIPPANLHFSHQLHLGLADVTCQTCHQGVETTGLATRDHLPSMETCLGCHDDETAPSACATCHPTRRDGTLQTAQASGQLVPDDHGGGWARRHEISAEQDLAYCASCHGQDECLSCHEGSLPPTFHEGDYLALHAQDGFANSPPCASCHRAETFCRDCHWRAGVVSGSRIPPFGETFHPREWSGFHLSRGHHAFVARRNIAACHACHDGETCKRCHGVVDSERRTHGPGWKGSARERRMRREAFGLCLECHDPSDPDDPIGAP